MGKFVRKFVCIALLFLLCLCLFFVYIDRKGWSDCNYKHFRSKGQQSLVIGTSRAAQAIRPSIINEKLADRGFALPIYNFSFNIGESPYGELYYNAIRNKTGVNPNGTSLFIVCVDPYALSDTDKELVPESKRREYGLVLDNIHHFYRPQLWYLFKYCRPLRWKNNYYEKLYDDGWLQIDAEMDSSSVAKRTATKLSDYSKITLHPSQYRIDWLIETIKLFKQNGRVFLVRIPMSDAIKQWEDAQWPDFSEDMIKISNEFQLDYFDFTNHNKDYRTTDGNHIFKDDAAKFTAALCDSISMTI